jgi:hypothetical protein
MPAISTTVRLPTRPPSPPRLATPVAKPNTRSPERNDNPSVNATSSLVSLQGLKPGSAGRPVSRLQARLAAVVPLSSAERAALVRGDGQFGRVTEALLRRFQRLQGLPPTGKVDLATAQRLEAPQSALDVAVTMEQSARARVRAAAERRVLDEAAQLGLTRERPPEALRRRASQAGDVAVATLTADIARLTSEEVGRDASDLAVARLPLDDHAGARVPYRVLALARITAQLDALDVSAAQMKPDGVLINLNTRTSVSTDLKTWNDWCLAFVASSFDRRVPSLVAPSAIEAARGLTRKGLLDGGRDPSTWRPGTIVFFEATRANKGAGHIAIFTGSLTPDGEPIIRTSGWRNHDGITELPLSELERLSGAFMGALTYPSL